jgi:hypothetical protein
VGLAQGRVFGKEAESDKQMGLTTAHGLFKVEDRLR